MGESLQHLSHRKLMKLAEPPRATDSRVDVVVVPSARPATELRSAVVLADELAVPLVVLCSRLSQRDRVVRFVGSVSPRVHVYAIDTPAVSPHPALTFSSDAVSTGRVFQRRSDTSLKRNLALLLARSVGWQRIMFLDDDIHIKDAADVRRAGGLLDEFAAVGLRIGGFPDNSVVCHAIRETGGKQDTFVGAGALAVKIEAQMSFFPNVYNEDWFFLLDKKNLRPLSTTKRVAAIQKPYDPFASPDRAIEEEFGDVLAEGALGILDDNGKIGDADIDYWERFLDSRAIVIGDVMARCVRQVAPVAGIACLSPWPLPDMHCSRSRLAYASNTCRHARPTWSAGTPRSMPWRPTSACRMHSRRSVSAIAGSTEQVRSMRPRKWSQTPKLSSAGTPAASQANVGGCGLKAPWQARQLCDVQILDVDRASVRTSR